MGSTARTMCVPTWSGSEIAHHRIDVDEEPDDREEKEEKRRKERKRETPIRG